MDPENRWIVLLAVIAGVVLIEAAKSLWGWYSERRTERLAARLGESEDDLTPDSPDRREASSWVVRAIIGGVIGYLVFRALAPPDVVVIERRRRPRRFGITHPDYRG